MKKNIIVVDIDGTLSKVGDRLKYIKQKPKDYNRFYEACFDDEPMDEVCTLVSLLIKKGDYRIVYLTGRRESVRHETSMWLCKHLYGSTTAPGASTLLMRPNRDFRHDTDVKLEVFQRQGYRVEEVAFVLEDRNSMVKMWRDLGVKCFQVKDGNY